MREVSYGLMEKADQAAADAPHEQVRDLSSCRVGVLNPIMKLVSVWHPGTEI